MRSKNKSTLRTALIYIGIFICGAVLVVLLLSFFDNTLNGTLREWFYRGYMTEYYDSEMATDYVQPDWIAIKGLAFRLALAVVAFCVIIIGIVSRLRLNAERRRIGNAVGQFMLSDTPEAGIPNEIAVPLSDAKSKLMRSQTLLREETARKNDLVMYLAHDLKTPLASLRLYCEMDESFHLSQQLTQIERMERLIQSLLRLERLCADGYEFTYDEQEVASIIRSCWAGLSATFPACTVEVIGNAIIRCDEKWLSEAFTNLLKNACEHMPEGGTVHVRMETTEAAFFCTVEDEGGGASGKDLPHLFERFYRAEGSPSSGAGIGLAIVREIIWRHHGTISAENTAKGLKMTISIPLMKMIRTYS